MPLTRYPPRNGHAVSDEELYELTEDGRLPDTTKLSRTYKDGSSIDWFHEQAVERNRIHALKAQAGIRGLFSPLLESSRTWLVVILAGMGIGITGAWLDVLASASRIDAILINDITCDRAPASELVANLFQECDASKPDYHGLCNPTAMWENVFLLVLTAMIKIVLTAWAFGMMIPAGIFLPTIAIGACLGRAVGLLTQELYRSYPTAWIFLACPPDPSERCISPGFYAVLGASAMLGGVTRMTSTSVFAIDPTYPLMPKLVSLVVIVFELTGALSHVLPIMICVMTSKFVGDAINEDGIYPVWIALRRYPWMSPFTYHDKGETGASIMKTFDELVVINDMQLTPHALGVFYIALREDEGLIRSEAALLRKQSYSGFPVVRGTHLVGFATREKLYAVLGKCFDPVFSTISQRSRDTVF
ncbi:hypothetical protein H0H93_008831 [Arthromyces matolae]|nr:hypothetical protein H0H93_008831 [Arthromyces matolae]